MSTAARLGDLGTGYTCNQSAAAISFMCNQWQCATWPVASRSWLRVPGKSQSFACSRLASRSPPCSATAFATDSRHAVGMAKAITRPLWQRLGSFCQNMPQHAKNCDYNSLISLDHVPQTLPQHTTRIVARATRRRVCHRPKRLWHGCGKVCGKPVANSATTRKTLRVARETGPCLTISMCCDHALGER